MYRLYSWPVRLVFALVVFSGGAAHAQRLLATTTTLSLTREAVRVYVQSVDMDTGAPLPGPAVLPGASPLGPLLAVPGAPIAAQCSGPPRRERDPDARRGWTGLSTLRTVPFMKEGRVPAAQGWRQFGACATQAPMSTELIFVALGFRADDAGARQGRADTYRARMERGMAAFAKDLEWEFAGRPVAAVILPGETRIAVLCRGPFATGAVLHMLDVVTGEILVEGHEIAEPDDLFGAAPAGLALTGDGKSLLALTSGYALEQASGDLSSWLHVFDSDTFEERSAPLALEGAAQAHEAPLKPFGAASCWIATRSRGTGFAYATLVQVTPDELTKAAHVPLTGVSGPFLLAPNPAGREVAVAIESRLEVWVEGRRGATAEYFDAAINAIRWTGEGLFLGEGARIHQVDWLSLKPLKTVQLQTGHVTDIVLLPAETLPARDPDGDGLSLLDETRMGTSPSSPDSDGDGIPDGSDPEPVTPSPRLTAPSAVTFHGEAVGNELKAFVIAPSYGDNSSWRVEYDSGRMPWMVIHPKSGEAGSLPTVVYMGIDPARYAPDGKAVGTLTVHLTGTQPYTHAAGSPATVEIHIAPAERSNIRRVLWMWDEGSRPQSFRDPSDPHNMRALAELLAAPPHLFAHHEAVGPFLDDLEPYTVVVLGAAAAARGAVTRQALLDYVVEGGALLFLGQYLDAQDTRGLTEWLGPIRIQIDTATKVEGAFADTAAHWLCKHWDNFRIAGGCAVRTDERSAILAQAAPDSSEAILLARTYGRGRIAVLASPTPLESGPMRSQSNSLFAADLFRWLGRAGTDPDDQDMDGDGLTDAVEDRNQNGVVDPGETDYFSPDTDDDGIPDGLEDLNLNGLVDEGETSPLNPDSDGDGVFDGADHVPLPPAGAPHIASVHPAQGPAEGGGVALVSGRNFPPDATVWFGNRRSPDTRVLRTTDLLVELPPCDSATGGDLPVRVADSSGTLEAVLPDGFRYTPLSKVRLVLDTLEVIHKQQQVYEGSTSVYLDCGPRVAPHQVMMLVKADPQEGFRWHGFNARATKGARSWGVVSRPTRAGDLLIVVLRGKRSQPIRGEVGVIHWEVDAALCRRSSLRILLEKPRVGVRNGQVLDVSVRDAVANLQGAHRRGD